MSFSAFGPQPPGSVNVDHRYKNAPQTSLEKIVQHQEISQRKTATEALLKNMVEISGDPSGSEPDPYFSRKDLETLKGFKALADHAGWPNSDSFDMKVSRRPGHPVWTRDPNQPFKGGLAQAILFQKAGETRKGYIFGRIAIAKPTQLVAICDDGKLYSQRGQELEKSYGEGWGKLPESGALEPTLEYGHLYGVDADTYLKPLKDRLLELLPKDVVASVNLEDFDLK